MSPCPQTPSRRALALPRRLTMLFAATAIALAGISATARPAQADVDDLFRFLAGVVVIAAIVNAIDDNHTPHYYGRWELPDSCLETMRVDWRTIQSYNARCLRRGGYSNLPNRCRHEFRVNGHRTRAGYIAECMWDAGYRRGHRVDRPYVEDPREPWANPSHDRLPSQCQTNYRQNGDRRLGYWGHCLNNAGFHNLPTSCRLQTRSGEHIFNAQCLYNAGYRAPR